DERTLEVLYGLPNLRALHLRRCTISLSPLDRANKIESLHLENCEVADFQPLVSLPELRSFALQFGECVPKSLSAITGRLNYEDFSENRYLGPENLEMPRLEALQLAGQMLTSMEWAKHLPLLRRAQFNGITSPYPIPLANWTSLRSLSLGEIWKS